jgi:hypothetical protein
MSERARTSFRALLSYVLMLALIGLPQSGVAQNNARMLTGVNTQTGTSYTFVAADTTRVVTFNNPNPVAVTLPNGATFGFGAGTMLTVMNLGAGLVTITCSSCTINGLPTLTLSQNQGLDIYGGAGNPPVNYIAPTNATAALPGGSNTQVQFNDGGIFNGAADLLYTKATGQVTSATQTAATGGANQSSPLACVISNYWTGAASAADNLCWQSVPGSGSNPLIKLTLTDSGGSPGGFALNLLAANVVQSPAVQICNSPCTVSQQLQTGSSADVAWQFPTAAPPNGGAFLAVQSNAGSPRQLAWRNSPWSGQPIDLTGQNAPINTTIWASTNLFAGATQYRVSWDAKVTTAAGTSSTLGPLTITYVDPDGTTQTITCAAQSKAGAIETTDTGNSTTTVLLGVPFLINSNNASNNITYAFGYASNAANAMVYNLHLRLEAVQ